MVFLKSLEEIAIMKESGAILSKTLGVLARAVKPGVTSKELDTLAEECIRDQGGVPSFKGYTGYPATLCVSINDAVVHGLPNGYALKEEDLVSIDCGVLYKGFHSDSAFTFSVDRNKISKEAQKLIKITKEALYLGIQQAVVGKRVGDIGAAVEKYVKDNGFSVVKDLLGHGVGRNLHEDPQVPNYGRQGTGVKLKKGMVIAIEPMVNQGGAAVREAKDGFTIRTADKKLSAHFEHTVAIGEGIPEILTSFQYIEEVLNK